MKLRHKVIYLTIKNKMNRYRISWATGKDNDLWCVAKSRTEGKNWVTSETGF